MDEMSAAPPRAGTRVAITMLQMSNGSSGSTWMVNLLR
ncbi:hypothetical protein I546_5012 [Mycobacterium kansasii 732]|nr:hypothetical protein I546_5012 [Mycobacterium kansasii 732]